MHKIVVIIGQTPDPHIDAVSHHLRDLSVEPVLFDRFDPGHEVCLHLTSTSSSGHFDLGGRRLGFEDVHAVWWRWKPLHAAEWTGAFEKVTEEFISGEWRSTLRGLPAYLPNAVWLNPLSKHFELHNKPAQIALAQSVGLRVPETSFTNDPEAVLELFSRHQRVIYKTITSFLVPPDEAIYTNEITLKDVQQSFASIRKAPGIFQELIEKLYELRVTIVGEKVFAVRINSQDRASTTIDWRHSQLEEMYEQVELEGDLQKDLLAFHSRAGLLYGAYDLVIDQAGQAVFLECNPGGQWLWLEHKLGIQVSREIALLLSGRDRESRVA